MDSSGKEQLMDIFDFALEKEKFSEEYYRRTALTAPNKGLSNILNMLADEEHVHYEVVSRMKQGVPVELAQTTVLTNAKAVFAKIRQNREKLKFGNSQIDLYKKAQDIEKDSCSFYMQKAQVVQDQHHKEIFYQLADEENKHYFLLENIIVFISRPQTWLENAEFHHLEQY